MAAEPSTRASHDVVPATTTPMVPNRLSLDLAATGRAASGPPATSLGSGVLGITVTSSGSSEASAAPAASHVRHPSASAAPVAAPAPAPAPAPAAPAPPSHTRAASASNPPPARKASTDPYVLTARAAPPRASTSSDLDVMVVQPEGWVVRQDTKDGGGAMRGTVAAPTRSEAGEAERERRRKEREEAAGAGWRGWMRRVFGGGRGGTTEETEAGKEKEGAKMRHGYVRIEEGGAGDEEQEKREVVGTLGRQTGLGKKGAKTLLWLLLVGMVLGGLIGLFVFLASRSRPGGSGEGGGGGGGGGGGLGGVKAQQRFADAVGDAWRQARPEEVVGAGGTGMVAIERWAGDGKGYVAGDLVVEGPVASVDRENVEEDEKVQTEDEAEKQRKVEEDDVPFFMRPAEKED
ncbi:hypothetical protein HDU96_004286 [Phlyctochytrium bullatum]|nr:hypothetical protein HDU96_004286 [Phlyctochytrium bullatum]